MIRITLFLLFILHSLNAVAENTIDKAPELKDIFYGETLFHSFQNNHFDAITHLDSELGQFYSLDNPSLDPFNQQVSFAEFSIGSFELAYRMHQRAGRAIAAIMESNLDQKIRNEAAYRLAQIFYRKNQPENAYDILQKIKGEMAEDLRVDEKYLRAQVYISIGKFSEAIKLLISLESDEKYKGFILYNLGIAYIQNDEEKKAIAALDEMGKIKSDDRGVLALKDKANLSLANRMLEKGSPELAKKYFSRVRLNGPFADRALLGLGWVNVSMGDFKKALVPWRILEKREITNESVQESMLAVPYAYGQLNYYGQAALSYGKAMDNFGAEIDRLQSSIKSVREGKFLKIVLNKKGQQDKNWLHNLRDLDETPETRYILSLMASNDFQQSLQNYRDLAELRARLSYWLASLDVYVELIEIRRKYYEPLLPVVEKQFKKLDARIRVRMSQRDRLDQRLKSLVIARRPEYLATAEERGIEDKLTKIEHYLSANPQKYTAEIRQRIARLKGVLKWNVDEAYHARLTNAYEQMQTLDVYIKKLNEAYQSFIRTRQAATQSYEGYDVTIRQLKTRIQSNKVKVDGVMARQGRLIEAMAVNELERRRNLLEEYQIKARFALAESYDRATKKQQKAEEEKILQNIQKEKQLQQSDVNKQEKVVE
jgi:anaphase-promoting complex subunit 3